MRLLGIDLGDRRTGLAVADSAMPIAAPLPTLERKSANENIVEPLRKVCEHGGLSAPRLGGPVAVKSPTSSKTTPTHPTSIFSIWTQTSQRSII